VLDELLGDILDNGVIKSFFASLKTEPTARPNDRARNVARADVFEDIERFYDAFRKRRRRAVSANATPSEKFK
jgi:putative transposase